MDKGLKMVLVLAGKPSTGTPCRAEGAGRIPAHPAEKGQRQEGQERQGQQGQGQLHSPQKGSGTAAIPQISGCPTPTRHPPPLPRAAAPLPRCWGRWSGAEGLRDPQGSRGPGPGSRRVRGDRSRAGSAAGARGSPRSS